MNLNALLASRRFAVMLIVVAVIAAFVVLMLAVSVPAAAPNTATVRRQEINAAVTATGKVRAKKSAKLSLPSSGVVASVDKMEGDSVNTGDVILTLRADEVNRRVKQAELNLQNRQLDLTRAKAAPRTEDIDIARANLQKATVAAAAADAAYAASATAPNDAARQVAHSDLDIARANFNRVVNGPRKEDLDALQNAVTAAQIDLDSAKAAQVQTRLTSPYTATVTEVDVREGELVGGFTQLAVVADASSLEIAADVDEIDVAHVQQGQSVEVRFDAFPGESFIGKLTRLFPAASSQRGATVYGAIVEFVAGKFQVRPGMGATLKIETIEKQNVLVVPNRAIKSVGARKAVHVVAPGEPHDQIVETGVTDGNLTEIVNGLNEGDQVSVQ